MALDEVQLACYWLLSVSFPLSSSTSVTHDFVSSPGDPLADVTSEFCPLISHHLLLDELEGITAKRYWLEFIGTTTYWCNGSAMMSCESADPQATRAIENCFLAIVDLLNIPRGTPLLGTLETPQGMSM